MPTKRQETELRLRQMAMAKVDMLLGVYEWPDKRPVCNPDGSPKVSHRELLRVAGYSVDYKNHMKVLFQDPYFLQQVQMELERRHRRSSITPYQPGRMKRVRDLLCDEVETRLRNDPTSFTNSQLLNALERYELLARDEERLEGGTRKADKIQQVNTFIAGSLNVMNQQERESLVETASDAADERISHLESVIARANIVDEAADDTDVIDVEVSPDPD